MMRARQENVVIAGAEHRPPSFLKIPEKMTALMDDYKQFSSCHAVESAARLHVDFVGIHPFVDGNGRATRLIEKWFLAKKLGDIAWFITSEKNYWNNRPT